MTRLPVISAIVFLSVFIGVATHSHFGRQRAWSALRVPVAPMAFADERGYVYRIDCVLDGYDTYDLAAPCKMAPPLYDYPPAWIYLRYLGVSGKYFNFIGVLTAALAAFACLILFAARGLVSTIIVFLALLSPAVLLGVERGNNDLIIFALVVTGIFFAKTRRPKMQSLTLGTLVVLVTVLKIYPIAVTALLAHSRKALLRTLLCGATALAALFITAGPHLHTIFIRSHVDYRVAYPYWGVYGAFPFTLYIAQNVAHFDSAYLLDHAYYVTIAVMCVGSIFAALGFRFRHRLNRCVVPMDFDNPRACIALAGVAIFCLTFAISSNYDYRLIFLLGPVAYLVEEFDRRSARRLLLPLAILLAVLWMPLWRVALTQTLDILIYVSGCAWLGANLFSAPRPWPPSFPHPDTVPPPPSSHPSAPSHAAASPAPGLR